jgi:hypothetical protein
MRPIWRESRAGFRGCRNKMLNFIKPTLWKMIITIVLLYVSSLLWRSFVISRISDTFPLGFPFEYYQAWGPCPPGQVCSEFNVIFLLLDVLIWYVFSAFVVARFRRKP